MFTPPMRNLPLCYLGQCHQTGFFQYEKGDLRIHVGQSLDELYLENPELIVTECEGFGPLLSTEKCIFRVPHTVVDLILNTHHIRPSAVLDFSYDHDLKTLDVLVLGERSHGTRHLHDLRPSQTQVMVGMLKAMGILALNISAGSSLFFPGIIPLLRTLSESFLTHILVNGSLVRPDFSTCAQPPAPNMPRQSEGLVVAAMG